MALRSIKKTNTRVRGVIDRALPPRPASAVIEDIDATAANTIRITFKTRVMPSQATAYKAGADGAETVSSVTTVADRIVELVFTGAVAGTDLIVEEDDPGIRTPTGGFVPAGTYAIPTFP